MTQQIGDVECTSAPRNGIHRPSTTLVQRWSPLRPAGGRTAGYPRAARGQFDTRRSRSGSGASDAHTRGRFAPRRAEAVQAYMRLTVLNLIRDEARRIARRP